MSSIYFIAGGGLSDSFRKVVESCFINVDGCIVEKSNGGFVIFGERVSTIDQVKERIKTAQGYLNNSIKK